MKVEFHAKWIHKIKEGCMNLELYRAKKMSEEDTDEGWSYGYFRKYLFVGKIVAEIATLNGESWSVDPETVGQCIGLKDKSGKRIFKGDIVRFKDTYNEDMPIKQGFVSFANGSFYINCGYSNHYRWIDYEYEVIGNIHENPELITA